MDFCGGKNAAISKIYLISKGHETIPNTLSIQSVVQERCVCVLRDIFITAVDVLLLTARRLLFFRITCGKNCGTIPL